MRSYLVILFTISPLLLQAQAPENLLLMRDDTLFQLNQKTDGHYQFVPYLQSPWLDSIGGLAYNKADNYWYGVNHNNAHIWRFQWDGALMDLGQPIRKEDKTPLPNADLNSAVIHEGTMYVLAYSTNSIYAIDLASDPLEYRTLVRNIGYSINSTLAFNSKNGQLVVLDQTGRAISITPQTGQLFIPELQGFKNYPRRSLMAYSRLWFTPEGRAFLLVNQDGVLYEVDFENQLLYEIGPTGFMSTHDAVCSAGYSPFLQPQLISAYIEPNPSYEALQVFWKQADNDEVIAYELQAWRKEEQAWQTIQRIPAFKYSKQTRTYAAMDRYVKEGFYQYRIKADLLGASSTYSPTLGAFYSPQNKTPKPQNFRGFMVSPSFSLDKKQQVYIQFRDYKKEKVWVQIRNPINKKVLFEQNVIIPADEYTIAIDSIQQGGWLEVLVSTSTTMQRFKLFHVRSYY